MSEVASSTGCTNCGRCTRLAQLALVSPLVADPLVVPCVAGLLLYTLSPLAQVHLGGEPGTGGHPLLPGPGQTPQYGGPDGLLP